MAYAWGHDSGGGAPWSVRFAVELFPACLLKTKQSSLKTINHSYEFIFINIISLSPSVPRECVDSPCGHLRCFILAQRVNICNEFLISSLSEGCSFGDLVVPQKQREMFMDWMLS